MLAGTMPGLRTFLGAALTARPLPAGAAAATGAAAAAAAACVGDCLLCVKGSGQGTEWHMAGVVGGGGDPAWQG